MPFLHTHIHPHTQPWTGELRLWGVSFSVYSQAGFQSSPYMRVSSRLLKQVRNWTKEPCSWLTEQSVQKQPATSSKHHRAGGWTGRWGICACLLSNALLTCSSAGRGLLGMLVPYLIAMTKIPDKELAHSWGDNPSWRRCHESGSGWLREAEPNECPVSPFCSIYNHGCDIVPPTFRVDLPPSASLTEAILQRHALRLT